MRWQTRYTHTLYILVTRYRAGFYFYFYFFQREVLYKHSFFFILWGISRNGTVKCIHATCSFTFKNYWKILNYFHGVGTYFLTSVSRYSSCTSTTDFTFIKPLHHGERTPFILSSMLWCVRNFIFTPVTKKKLCRCRQKTFTYCL